MPASIGCCTAASAPCCDGCSPRLAARWQAAQHLHICLAARTCPGNPRSWRLGGGRQAPCTKCALPGSQTPQTPVGHGTRSSQHSFTQRLKADARRRLTAHLARPAVDPLGCLPAEPCLHGPEIKLCLGHPHLACALGQQVRHLRTRQGHRPRGNVRHVSERTERSERRAR